MYGPEITFLGIPRVDLSDDAAVARAEVAILGAPFDGGTSFRAGCRFGPRAIRGSDSQSYDGSRPHLAMRVDPLKDLRVIDVGDVEMPAGDIELSLGRLRDTVRRLVGLGVFPVVLGGDHSIAYANIGGLQTRYPELAVVQFDAHADTGDTHFGQRLGHGTPMRRLIEDGTCSGERFFQIGLRGYWPGPDVLAWMAAAGIRSYEMTELRARGLDVVLDEVCAASARDFPVFLAVDIDVVDPGMAPGTGTPEPGGLTSWELLSAVRHVCSALDVRAISIAEVSPPYDHADVTALLANRVVLEALSAIARRRAEQSGGESWRPQQPLLDGR
ncbi:MAG: agmatinase [Solirubrobacteraceae bacterium]|jgi:agmatinase|nr:agmatinase [Solirubrobacteraceae bacterium]